jgi:hypothetical protein
MPSFVVLIVSYNDQLSRYERSGGLLSYLMDLPSQTLRQRLIDNRLYIFRGVSIY